MNKSTARYVLLKDPFGCRENFTAGGAGRCRQSVKKPSLNSKAFGRRQVVASFDGGRISSDGGLLLLREVANQSGLLKRFGRCFTDYRDSRYIEHSVEELVSQRVLALAQGYED